MLDFFISPPHGVCVLLKMQFYQLALLLHAHYVVSQRMNVGHANRTPLTPFMEVQRLPKKAEAFAGQRVIAVSAGEHHSIALTADGAVWSWGFGACGKLGHGDEHSPLLPKKIEALAGQRIVAVSAGVRHSIALTADGAVFTWGQGERGCLGHGEDLSNQLLPKKVEARDASLE